MTETPPAESPIAPNEAALLRAAPVGGRFGLEELLPACGLRLDQAQSSAEALVARGLLAREEQVARRLVRGSARLIELEIGGGSLRQGGTTTVQAAQDVPGAEKSAVGAAFGWLKKQRAIAVQGQEVSAVSDAPAWALLDQLQGFLDVVAAAGPGGLPWEDLSAFPAPLREEVERRLPAKRGGKKDEELLLRVEETRTRTYLLSEAGAAARARLGEARPEVAQLTPQMLKDGSWRDVTFRPFNVAEPPALLPGRKNPYRAYLDQVKTKLLALGFEEMSGPLVETEFWNMDALFLPQFHPAREIHDVYFVQRPGGGHVHAREIEHGALEPVAREHEGRGGTGSRGWAYDFDRERTKRLVLRSQGTALSARWLPWHREHKGAASPGKYFAMARCFRYDDVDATHAPDFFQVEGIVVSEGTTFRHLLGLLQLFAREVARASEVRYVPAYFPFTEPSVEVHARHPDLGWMELGGAGIFRPEVTRPHGIEHPVIAWGLGLDRMAMVALGVKDIRHLFTNNLPEGLSGLRQAAGRVL
mgnify:CR=1 FL=1